LRRRSRINAKISNLLTCKNGNEKSLKVGLTIALELSIMGLLIQVKNHGRRGGGGEGEGRRRGGGADFVILQQIGWGRSGGGKEAKIRSSD
jgi:hypothetical protein